jgi:HAD superfamily hydrolase (TIGR01509 family)
VIRAVLFDLDGTIWDSEIARFRSWQRVFEEHGRPYAVESFAQRLGTVGGPDPVDELEDALGVPIDHDAVWRRMVELEEASLAELEPKPGVVEFRDAARARGFAVGVVSTDERDYVVSSLERLGLRDGWDVIVTADGDVARAKPSPALYLEAAEALGISPGEAVAIEDSPNGVLAATRAGVFCVAVTHEVTASLDVSHADLVVGSLQGLSLDAVIELAERRSA